MESAVLMILFSIKSLIKIVLSFYANSDIEFTHIYSEANLGEVRNILKQELN